jgi:hypothetical protein
MQPTPSKENGTSSYRRLRGTFGHSFNNKRLRSRKGLVLANGTSLVIDCEVIGR